MGEDPLKFFNSFCLSRGLAMLGILTYEVGTALVGSSVSAIESTVCMEKISQREILAHTIVSVH